MEKLRKEVLDIFTQLEMAGITTESHYRNIVQATNDQDVLIWMKKRLQNILKRGK